MLRWACGTWRRWRDDRICRRYAIPDTLWQLTLARFPFLTWRTSEDQSRLRRLTTLFLARKEFSGAQGFVVTDEIAVAVSAQAVLPVLNLGLGLYDGFVGIVMHSDAVVAQREVIDEDGIVHQFEEELSGEAMHGGPVMLSWHDVDAAGVSDSWGYNVAIHEFAHVIDMVDGAADGVPALRDREARAAWLSVMEPAYADFCVQVDSDQSVPIDPYAAESIDEFFAVTSESFFVDPGGLHQAMPQVYRLLAGYFGQDPLAAPPGRNLASDGRAALAKQSA
ncbi:MAG: zinc-dependent peptidase [Burkholderiaceae bacterium]|nr:zinc-dependent peptidase [Burkholderiaceae bacterium]